MNVTAIYNWKGHLTGYKRDNAIIPIDEGNRDYQIIQEGIANGTCIVDEPELGEVTETYNHQGNLSGYRWNGLFVPIDEENRNYQVVKKAIEEGNCTVKITIHERLNSYLPKIDAIIFCIFFNQPWQHITDCYKGKISYRSNSRATYVEYDFRLINLPLSEKLNATNFLLGRYNISKDFFSIIEFSIKSGVLELEVPVNRLLKLFRNEHQLLEENTATFLEDCLSQHIEESGRASKGPDINWLISLAKTYLQNFIMEVGNRIIEAYTREYGTLPIGYIDKWKIYEETIVINKNKNGDFSIGSFGLQGKQSFNLSGDWQSNSLLQVSQPEKYPTHPQAHALQRVRMLVKAGLHMEALCLLNAFLEVNVKGVLYYCIKSDIEAQKTILEMNHRQRLEILQKIAKAVEDNFLFGKDYISRVENAIEIYKHRNDYVHDLTLPKKEETLSVKQRRALENLMYGFIDVFESERWFGWQRRIASGENADAITIIKQFLRKWSEVRYTAAQTSQCFILCQKLTMFYKPIYLVRLDERTGEVVIIAGEEAQIAIAQNGEWTFKR